MCMREHVSYLCTADGYTAAVDVYNSSTGLWSIAQISVPRGDLSATSIGNLAIFVGGWTGTLFCSRPTWFRVSRCE